MTIPTRSLALNAILVGLALAGTGYPQHPPPSPSPLPEWVDVRLRFARPPEFGTPTELVAQIDLLLGPSQEGRYRILLPENVRAGGTAATAGTTGTLSLTPGERATVSREITVLRPLDGRSLVFELDLILPRDTLRQRIEAEAERGADEARSRLQFLERTGDDQTVHRSITLSSTPEETWTAEEGPIFGRWFNGPGETRLTLYETRPGMDPDGLETRARELTETLKIVGSEPTRRPGDEVLAELEAQHLGELFDIRYQQVVHALVAGDAREAGRRLEALTVPASRTSPVMELALDVARGVKLVLERQPESAKAAFIEGLKAAGDHPAIRYVHYLRGEVLRSQGQVQEARKAYRRALLIKPNFTQASRRLGSL